MVTIFSPILQMKKTRGSEKLSYLHKGTQLSVIPGSSSSRAYNSILLLERKSGQDRLHAKPGGGRQSWTGTQAQGAASCSGRPAFPFCRHRPPFPPWSPSLPGFPWHRRSCLLVSEHQGGCEGSRHSVLHRTATWTGRDDWPWWME